MNARIMDGSEKLLNSDHYLLLKSYNMKLSFALVVVGHVLGFVLACFIVFGYKIDPQHPGDWPFVLMSVLQISALIIGYSTLFHRFRSSSKEESMRAIQELL